MSRRICSAAETAAKRGCSTLQLEGAGLAVAATTRRRGVWHAVPDVVAARRLTNPQCLRVVGRRHLSAHNRGECKRVESGCRSKSSRGAVGSWQARSSGRRHLPRSPDVLMRNTVMARVYSCPLSDVGGSPTWKAPPPFWDQFRLPWGVPARCLNGTTTSTATGIARGGASPKAG